MPSWSIQVRESTEELNIFAIMAIIVDMEAHPEDAQEEEHGKVKLQIVKVNQLLFRLFSFLHEHSFYRLI